MTLSIDKIVSMDAVKYCEMIGENFSDFRPVAVHHTYQYGYTGFKDDKFIEEALGDFAKKVPKKAVAVVDYQFQLATLSEYILVYMATGTALIPKDNKDRQSENEMNNDIADSSDDQDKLS